MSTDGCLNNLINNFLFLFAKKAEFPENWSWVILIYCLSVNVKETRCCVQLKVHAIINLDSCILIFAKHNKNKWVNLLTKSDDDMNVRQGGEWMV